MQVPWRPDRGLKEKLSQLPHVLPSCISAHWFTFLERAFQLPHEYRPFLSQKEEEEKEEIEEEEEEDKDLKRT